MLGEYFACFPRKNIAIHPRAAEYADYLAQSDTFEHSGDEDNGENLYWSWSSDPAWVCGGEEAVSSWYEESRGYNYRAEPRDTQVCINQR